MTIKLLLLDFSMDKILEDKLPQIKTLCDTHDVKQLAVFGSVLTNDFNKNSDVDFIIDIQDQDPVAYTDKYFDFKFNLEDLIGRPIDLLEQKALKNPYLRQEIDNTKVLIYGI